MSKKWTVYVASVRIYIDYNATLNVRFYTSIYTNLTVFTVHSITSKNNNLIYLWDNN